MAERYSRPEPLRGKHKLDSFESGEQSLDDWLRRYARRSEVDHTARIFVTTTDGEGVVGYYALAAGSVSPAEALARAKQGQPARRPIPVVLLARLAVDSGHQGAGVGVSLLQDALLRSRQVAGEIGARAILAHAMSDRAREWYVRFGFEASPTSERQLMLLMKDAEKFVEAAGEAE